MNTNNPEISLVIITFNGLEFVDDCLATTYTSLANVSSEVIIIDNGSDDGTPELIDSKYPEVILIRNENNMGFARAANQGFELARGQYIFLLNQDTRIRDGAIVQLADRMKGEDKIGTIGPRFIGFDGRLQKSCRAFPNYSNMFFAMTGLSRLFPGSRILAEWKMTWFDHLTEREVDQPMGAALMIRRNVLEELGGFDEAFGIFFNDVDFCRRVKEAGYINLYYPDAVVEHFYGGTIRKMKASMVLKWHRSLFRYFRKYSRSFWSKGLLLLWGPFLFITGFLRAARHKLIKS
jgi:GT2 family glycosyltransferase